MTIKRSTPDVGYFDPELFAAINVSQTVRAKDTVHFSGIVSARAKGEVVAPGDAGGQVAFVLEILARLLEAEGMTYANLVSATVFTPVLEQIESQLTQFTGRFKGHPPCLTLIGVNNLASPEYLLEMVAVAVD